MGIRVGGGARRGGGAGGFRSSRRDGEGVQVLEGLVLGGVHVAQGHEAGGSGGCIPPCAGVAVRRACVEDAVLPDKVVAGTHGRGQARHDGVASSREDGRASGQRGQQLAGHVAVEALGPLACQQDVHWRVPHALHKLVHGSAVGWDPREVRHSQAGHGRHAAGAKKVQIGGDLAP